MLKLTLIHDTGETCYFIGDDSVYYALDYWYMDKSEFREFGDIQPEYSYLDEDGDVCHEWDDDSWDVEPYMIEAYVENYLKRKYKIIQSGDDAEDGDIFKVQEGDNGWYEELEKHLELDEKVLKIYKKLNKLKDE